MKDLQDARRRYARHVVLAEVGEAGQARLSAARVRPPAGVTAREYLRRAGVVLDDAGVASAASDSPGELVRDPALRDAAAAVADAFAAVEVLKALLGAGTPASWPDGLLLDEDPA